MYFVDVTCNYLSNVENIEKQDNLPNFQNILEFLDIKVI